MVERPTSLTTQADYCVQVVDDHHMTRFGLMALAQASGVLGISWLEAGNLADAMQAHRQGHEPSIDLVLLDLNLPDSQGLQGLRTFLREFPQLQIAVFSATQDEYVMRQALGLGAVGFLPKSGPAADTLRLIESILLAQRASAERDHALVANTVVDSFRGLQGGLSKPSFHLPDTVAVKAATLNTTQLKVLELLLEGLSNHEIAKNCHLALGTVKNAVSFIYLTLDVQSRAHLISLFR